MGKATAEQASFPPREIPQGRPVGQASREIPPFAGRGRQRGLPFLCLLPRPLSEMPVPLLPRARRAHRAAVYFPVLRPAPSALRLAEPSAKLPFRRELPAEFCPERKKAPPARWRQSAIRRLRLKRFPSLRLYFSFSFSSFSFSGFLPQRQCPQCLRCRRLRRDIGQSAAFVD